MKTWIRIEFCDIENDDVICGFKAKDLIIFATAVRKAGIENKDLAMFAKNAQNAYDFVIKMQQEAMEESLHKFSIAELQKEEK